MHPAFPVQLRAFVLSNSGRASGVNPNRASCASVSRSTSVASWGNNAPQDAQTTPANERSPAGQSSAAGTALAPRRTRLAEHRSQSMSPLPLRIGHAEDRAFGSATVDPGRRVFKIDAASAPTGGSPATRRFPQAASTPTVPLRPAPNGPRVAGREQSVASALQPASRPSRPADAQRATGISRTPSPLSSHDSCNIIGPKARARNSSREWPPFTASRSSI